MICPHAGRTYSRIPPYWENKPFLMHKCIHAAVRKITKIFVTPPVVRVMQDPDT